MADFSKYDIPVVKYSRMFAAYLQNDGTQLMNKVKFKYDLINEYKERVVEFWSLFDINYLESAYLAWRKDYPDFNAYPDSDWIFTGFLENICKTYQITREYFSYWATTTEDPDNLGNNYETGGVLLNNLNMIRLLKIRRSSVGFNGTRESLVAILENALTGIDFILRTKTETGKHAELQVYIIRPDVVDGDVLWTDNDLYLAQDNEYFIQLLGIVTDFEIVDSTALIFDAKRYDGLTEYK